MDKLSMLSEIRPGSTVGYKRIGSKAVQQGLVDDVHTTLGKIWLKDVDDSIDIDCIVWVTN